MIGIKNTVPPSVDTGMPTYRHPEERMRELAGGELKREPETYEMSDDPPTPEEVEQAKLPREPQLVYPKDVPPHALDDPIGLLSRLDPDEVTLRIKVVEDELKALKRLKAILVPRKRKSKEG